MPIFRHLKQYLIMNKDTAIKLFESKKIRSVWDDDVEKWYFSIVDVVSILTNQPHHQGARNYWKVLKSRLLKEGNETVTNCNRLKLEAEDGKQRETDVADTEQLFRLIQSIPSPKAEPFKLWLAKAGRERIDEIEDPEIRNFHFPAFLRFSPSTTRRLAPSLHYH
jgi:prophage antirepressor-like protein